MVGGTGRQPYLLSERSAERKRASALIVKKDGDDWIGWVEEVPGVNAQEKTKAKLLKSLRIVLKEALEFNRAEAREAAVADYAEELLTV